MKLVSEPSIDLKIRRMQERVRWQHDQIRQQGIDQTRLSIQGAGDAGDAFSFLVLGDSGTGRHRSSSPQRQVAKQMMAHGQDARFVIHTGDVVYLVGSSEQYRENFIKPYREWLVGGEAHKQIAYDRMTFKMPFFPVLGNHDYYDLPKLVGFLAGITGPLRYVLRSYVDIDVGWHGSYQGDAYARAFLDYLQGVPERRLDEHLTKYYPHSPAGDRCLAYQPGHYTRLPNRYYTFRYGGIDFFALDSNTFNQPLPFTASDNPEASRQRLQTERRQLEAQKAKLLQRLSAAAIGSTNADEREDCTGQIEEIDEAIYDIDKQLSNDPQSTVDREQLDWLRDRLIASWQDADVRGRILFFHHPPYVTEATKWKQGQTLAIRHHLRQVLDAVLVEVAEITQGQPLLNLVLCGHAHCLEYLKTLDTGHGDAHIPWVVCGGSGYSLRRQRAAGSELTERVDGEEKPVASSRLFVGRSGKGSTLKRPYSGLRIDVADGTPLKLSITPVLAEKLPDKWHPHTLKTIEL
ncbi:MAG: metallophosphoesterase family protein [Leptolyngbyaceae cyanobacterium]